MGRWYGGDGAGMELGPAAPAVGRAHRRVVVAAVSGACAAVLCTVGALMSLRGGAIAAVASPSSASVHAMLDNMRGSMVVPQATNSEMDAYQALEPALARARQSQLDMASLVNYYAKNSAAATPEKLATREAMRPLLQGYNTLHRASWAWDAHRAHLEELNSEIMRQQATLHSMHMHEQVLSARHEQIKNEIAKLQAASGEVARQLEELKGQYSVQINDLKSQYYDLARALKKEKDAAYEELTENMKEQHQQREAIQDAMSKEAFYGTQARHAEEDVEKYRTRARDWETEEKKNRQDVKTWEDVAAEQNIKEQDAKAGKKAAELEEQARLDISKIKARAAAVNTARHAKAITIEAQARVEDALKEAGERAAEAAAEQEEASKQTMETYDDKKAAVEDKILAAKGEQAMSTVQETQAKMLMTSAKLKYWKIMSEIKRVVAVRKKSIQVENAAQAKLAAVETEGKISELMSESAAALASARAEAGEKAVSDLTNKMAMSKDAEEEIDTKKEDLMAATLAALGEKLDAENEAKFVRARAEVADGHAKTVLDTAEKHRTEAEDLLKSVHELGHLAKQAAEVAAAERIKAQAAAVAAGAGYPCVVGVVGCADAAAAPSAHKAAVASISNPSIHVHVVPR